MRTRLPSPSGTRNIMRPMPVVTPNRHGSPFRNAGIRPGGRQHDVAGTRRDRGHDGEKKTRDDLLRSRTLPPPNREAPRASLEDASACVPRKPDLAVRVFGTIVQPDGRGLARLVVAAPRGRIFVERGGHLRARRPDFAARQNSGVQYGHLGSADADQSSSRAYRRAAPTRVTLAGYDYYSITAGRLDGPPRRITPQQAEAIAAWRSNDFKARRPIIPQPPIIPGKPIAPMPPPRPPQPTPIR